MMTPDYLRAWRRQHGSQTEVAARMGKSLRQWHRYENDPGPVPQEIALAVGYVEATGRWDYDPADPPPEVKRRRKRAARRET